MAYQQNPYNQQKITELDKRTPVERRQEMLMTAVRMRLNGSRYEIISSELKKAGFRAEEQTIRTWFAKGGEVNEVYETLRTHRLQELKQDLSEADNQLKEAAIDAIAILREGMVSGRIDPQQESIAKDILDRSGYPKSNKTDVSGKIESDSMTTVAQGIKAILERK